MLTCIVALIADVVGEDLEDTGVGQVAKEKKNLRLWNTCWIEASLQKQILMLHWHFKNMTATQKQFNPRYFVRKKNRVTILMLFLTIDNLGTVKEIKRGYELVKINYTRKCGGIITQSQGVAATQQKQHKIMIS